MRVDAAFICYFVKKHAKRKGSRLGHEKVKLKGSGVK